MELTTPQWRIVKVPDMSLAEAQSLLAPDLGNPDLGYLPQRRKFTVDESLFQLPETAAFVADDTRSVPFMTFSSDQLRGVIVARPPLIDPDFTGY